MALIKVKFDPTIEHSDIIIPLTNSSKDEMGDEYQNNQPMVQQTSVYGIQAPLIMVNKTVIDFSDVLSFTLKSTGVFPTVQMTVKDRNQILAMIDTPGIDNELRVEILPKFEDKYKKINLTFYITSSKIENGIANIKGEYKLRKFTDSVIKSFGELNTYKLLETIALDTGLGYTTNIEENDGDKRWIYCNNKSYKETLDHEITFSGVDEQILDYWVDWWNYLTLVDINDKYTNIDPEEDMQIWIAGSNQEVEEGVEVPPQQVVATLNNSPSDKLSELYITNMRPINKSGSQLHSGTDRMYSIYEDFKSEHIDYLIQDGDAKKDIFVKFEYLGEVYGGYNYILNSKKREAFFQKIKTNDSIEINVKTPLLGLLRGNKVNILWYVNDSKTENLRDELVDNNCIAENVETNIPLNETSREDKPSSGGFVLDKSISGQYLITSCEINFSDKEWEYKLILNRPTIDKPKLIDDENEQ